MPELLENTEEIRVEPEPGRVHLLKTGFLVAASAMLGGLAVVLWNRNTLAKLRQPHSLPAKPDVEEE